MKILIAEDEPTFRQMLAVMLTRLGFEPVLSCDGNEAWQHMSAEGAPQLAIIDWLMPGMDGVELCRKIREEKPEPYTYLILVTGKKEEKDIITGMEAGADDYLTKPVTPDELRVHVNAGKRIIELQNQLVAARESEAAHAADLEALNSSLEGFSYTVTNNILISLQSIASSARMIQDLVCVTSDGRCKSQTKFIYDKTKALAEIISSMHAFLKPMRAQLVRQTLNLSKMAAAVAEALRKSEPERAMTFRIAEGILANADRGLMQVVLEKLLGNAWRHTKNQEQGLIEFGVTEVQGEQTYFVRDNGIGFQKEYGEKLFLPFFSIPGTEELRGHGIGLATIERIIRRHGGRISAEGEVGKGATFRFTLPMLGAQQQS